jgi:hypothetical protein
MCTYSKVAFIVMEQVADSELRQTAMNEVCNLDESLQFVRVLLCAVSEGTG